MNKGTSSVYKRWGGRPPVTSVCSRNPSLSDVVIQSKPDFTLPSTEFN